MRGAGAIGVAANALARAEAQAASPAVSLAGIDITFNLKYGGRYQAVSQINLDVAPGEFVAVVGPTGCGKSTLLNAAAGLLQPSAGKVGILGEPLRGLNLQAGYLVKERVGRNNRYTVHGEFPLRHPLNDKATVADLLAIFN